MDIKRRVFLLLTIIFNLSLLLIPIYSLDINIEHYIAAYICIFILTFMLNVFLSLITIILYEISIKEEGDTGSYVPFTLGFLTFSRKRIYYSELGYFYIRKYKNKLVIHKQNYFSTKELFSINVSDDLESIKQEIKNKLENIYRKELEEKRKSDVIKNWDGYIDLVSKRDDTINQIIK